MNVYTTDRIRNVVLLGHGGSGKTSLTEAMAYLGGITSRLGNVTEGNTISDFDKEEIKRKFSISTTAVPIKWGDVKINVLDTPGYFDFVGEDRKSQRKRQRQRTLRSSSYPERTAWKSEHRKHGSCAKSINCPACSLSQTWTWTMQASVR